jgi:hypothetical protein
MWKALQKSNNIQLIIFIVKMASNEDHVVKTRLLLDGDGGGDDRRLNNLAKQVKINSFLILKS